MLTARSRKVILVCPLQVLEPMKLLAAENVVHFDLKCANILVDPLPGVKDSELWNPLAPKFIPLLPNPPLAATSAASQDVLFESALAKGPQTADGVGATPPFGVVLADFGEARAYRSAAEAFTARNRGTEVFKSPEMLMLNMPAGRDGSASLISCSTTLPSTPPPGCPLAGLAHVNVNANAGSPVAVALSRAGIASDVWSFGCLAYELLSGNVLFGADYASVTHRVAFGGGDNLALLVSERAALGGQAVLIELVEWILARDPAKRPKPDAISERIQAAINVLQ